MEQLENHEHFQELAALAALGELSCEEYAELNVHLEACLSCKEEYDRFSHLLRIQLPAGAEARSGVSGKLLQKFSSCPGGLKERFVIKAHAEGFRFFQAPVEKKKGFWSKRVPFAPVELTFAGVSVLFSVALALALGYHWGQNHAPNDVRVSEESSATRTISATSLSGDHPVPAAVNAMTDQAEALATRRRLEHELAEVRAKYDALSSRYQTLEQQLGQASSASVELKKEIESARLREDELLGKLQQYQDNLSQANKELVALRGLHDDDLVALNERQARLDQLEKELAGQSSLLDRSKELLAKDRDIRDVMGARKLHITDVYDVDGKGKSRKPFGRVFLTEGKSLIFYAFDLEKTGSTLKAASLGHDYQVWGYKEAAKGKMQSLGILYMDDQKQSRWKLQFGDPAVLSEIDTVFVTVEPPGGSQKPSSQQLLYAYLGEAANHP